MYLKRNILYCGLFLFVVGLSLISCSDIDENDRLIYVKPADVNRAVLIEDFTGQNCSNCPAATEVIKELQEQYGEDNVIAVAIHSGPFGHRTTMSSPRLPLCTETGDAYYTYWGITAQPGVKINRGNPIYNTALYGATVYEAIEEPSPLNLTVDMAEYDQKTRTLDIKIGAITNENLTGKLQVWIIENNIVSQQKMGDGSMNSDYVHQHVFRASVTQDIYGDDITVTEGEEKSVSYSTTLDEDWVAENVEVVAFVSNTANGVLQVVKSDITEDENN